jgi:hypothetical protein
MALLLFYLVCVYGQLLDSQIYMYMCVQYNQLDDGLGCTLSFDSNYDGNAC